MKIILILLIYNLLMVQCDVVEEEWEQFPLTHEDLTLIMSDQSQRIPVRNDQNQTCLLTPAEFSSSCSWRSQRRCKQIPTKRKVPVLR